MVHYQCFKCKNNALDGDGVSLICKNFLCMPCLRVIGASNVNRLYYPYFNKSHNLGKHIRALSQSNMGLDINIDLALGSIFNFQDDFIDSFNNGSDEVVSLNEDDLNQYSAWLDNIIAVSSINENKLGILHLNINSLKNKKDSIARILDTLQFGIIMLN